LGPSLFCAEGASGSEAQLRDTAALCAELLGRLDAEPGWQQELAQNGVERIGSGGGAARMANDIAACLRHHRHD
jgi:hypothetical protein